LWFPASIEFPAPLLCPRFAVFDEEKQFDAVNPSELLCLQKMEQEQLDEEPVQKKGKVGDGHKCKNRNTY
jgi:hypothetical protein